jgi:hypothetical protein
MRKTTQGVWKLCVAARDSAGKPRRLYRTVRAQTTSQAAAALASFVAEVHAQSVHAPSDLANLDMDDAVATFLSEHLRDERGREEKTIRDYAALHDLWFAPYIGRQLVHLQTRAG